MEETFIMILSFAHEKQTSTSSRFPGQGCHDLVCHVGSKASKAPTSRHAKHTHDHVRMHVPSIISEKDANKANTSHVRSARTFRRRRDSSSSLSLLEVGAGR